MPMRRKWLLAGALPAGAFVLGLVETNPDRMLDMDSLFSTAMAAAFVLMVFCWYRADAGDRGYRTSWGLNIAMLTVTVFALPWYLVRSRSGVPAAVALLFATGTFVLCGAAYRLASTLAAGI